MRVMYIDMGTWYKKSYNKAIKSENEQENVSALHLPSFFKFVLQGCVE